MKLILLVIAVFFFLLAAGVAAGITTGSHFGWFEPAGLAAMALALIFW